MLVSVEITLSSLVVSNACLAYCLALECRLLNSSETRELILQHKPLLFLCRSEYDNRITLSKE